MRPLLEPSFVIFIERMNSNTDPNLNTVLKKFGIDSNSSIYSFGSGLINHTWKIDLEQENALILQKINENVFKDPENISYNIGYIAGYLKNHFPNYFLPIPLVSTEGKDFVRLDGGGFYRLFEYVKGSHSVDTLLYPEQAFQAAKAFGKFTRLLSGIGIEKIKTTLVHFHDLSFRYFSFMKALEKASSSRKLMAEQAIEFIGEHNYLVETYEQIIRNPDFKLRVTHHDTKINNVLFDKANNPLCVIDLDTVMPGYFFSDLGDMMRTYLSPVSEEEQNFNRIEVREDYLIAIIKGYLSEMQDELSTVEKNHLLFSGLFILYMQAMRFLTDFLNNDIYYDIKYPENNLNRALNQIKLFNKLKEKEYIFKNYPL